MGMTIEESIKAQMFLQYNNLVFAENEEIVSFIFREYEQRLKADMVAMLTEIQLEIEELDPFGDEWSDSLDACSDIIQQKINALKGEQGENTN